MRDDIEKDLSKPPIGRRIYNWDVLTNGKIHTFDLTPKEVKVMRLSLSRHSKNADIPYKTRYKGGKLSICFYPNTSEE